MLRQSFTRNRTKGFKVKHAFQIALLLAVCIWLIYQVKHSQSKRKDYGERHVKVSSNGIHGGSVFGRKENPGFKLESDGEKVGEGKGDGDERMDGGNDRKDGGGGDDELDRDEEEKAEEEARGKEHEDLKENSTSSEEKVGEGEKEGQNERQANDKGNTQRENNSGDAQEKAEEGEGRDTEKEDLKENSTSPDKKIGEEEHYNEEERRRDDDSEVQVKVEDDDLLSKNDEQEEKIEQHFEENDATERVEEISLNSNGTEGSDLDQSDSEIGIQDFPDQNGVPNDGGSLETLGHNEKRRDDEEENFSTDDFQTGSPDVHPVKDSDNQSLDENTTPEGDEIVHPSIPDKTIDTGLPTKDETVESEAVASQEDDGAAAGTEIIGRDNAEGAESDRLANINANADGESSVVSEEQKEGFVETLQQSQSEAVA